MNITKYTFAIPTDQLVEVGIALSSAPDMSPFNSQYW